MFIEWIWECEFELLLVLYLVVAVYWVLVDGLMKLPTRGYGVLGV